MSCQLQRQSFPRYPDDGNGLRTVEIGRGGGGGVRREQRGINIDGGVSPRECQMAFLGLEAYNEQRPAEACMKVRPIKDMDLTRTLAFLRQQLQHEQVGNESLIQDLFITLIYLEVLMLEDTSYHSANTRVLAEW
jgi:hypothetical protein